MTASVKVCSTPALHEARRGWSAGLSGQTLNKPPWTKPRNALKRFEEATAYGDLRVEAADERAIAGESRWVEGWKSAPGMPVGAMNPGGRCMELC